MTPYRLLIVALAAALGALALVNWRLAVTPVDVAPQASAEVEPEPADTPPAPAAGSPRRRALEELTETLERPLFAPDRRPTPPAKGSPAPAAPAAEAEPEAAGLRLVGMMRVGGSDHRALIRVPGETHASWVTIGAQIGGWTVRAIEKDKVVVESASRRAELLLRAAPAEDGGEEPDAE